VRTPRRGSSGWEISIVDGGVLDFYRRTRPVDFHRGTQAKDSQTETPATPGRGGAVLDMRLTSACNQRGEVEFYCKPKRYLE
jgi:hypothetical protein